MASSSSNPFENMRRVMGAQELLDLAFSKAMKIKPPSVSKSDALNRSRQHESNRINTAANVLVDRLDQIIHQFPSMKKIHPFYQEMADLYLGVDEVQVSLGRVNGVIEHIRNIQDDLNRDLVLTKHKNENKQIRKRAFGRLSSIIYQIRPQLEKLQIAKQKLSQLPGFNPMLPTIVIAGIPNAGKSSFIKLTTSGSPEIASYPFTTKEVLFGHRKMDFLTIQFVDTPGLLDRSFYERNDIELKAILALKYLTDILLFFVDPTDEASCSLDEQLNLLEEIKKFYSSLAFIPVITKNDLVKEDKISQIRTVIKDRINISFSSIYSINILNFTGADHLLDKLEEIIKENIIKSRKFRKIILPEIDPEMLPTEDDPMWDESF